MEKILIADDVEMNRDLLSDIFDEQFDILEACDGEEAIKILDEYGTDISLVLLDLMMPKKSGLDVMEHMRYKGIIDKIPVIMITGESTDESNFKAYEYGADDILFKPYVEKIIIRRAMNLIDQYKYKKDIEKELQKRTIEIIKSHKEVEDMNEFLINALGSVIEFRSAESGRHIEHVKYFTKIILEYVKSCFPEYGLTNRQIDMMSKAAALHDVGKIAISDAILNAPRKLKKNEFEEMKKHTIFGCQILEKFKIKDNEFYKYCYEICRWHHEKYDGKGYPDGLKGEEIPIYCQAAGLADCFDALCSRRVYKKPIECSEAYNMIVRGECGEFSEVILKCFELARLEMFMAFEKMDNDIL